MTNVAESGGANVQGNAALFDGVYRFAFNEQTRVYSLFQVAVRDTDADGIDDAWEEAHGFSPKDARDAWDDADGDGLTAREEFELGGDPALADTDGDGMDDFAESVAGTRLDDAESVFAAVVETGAAPKLSWPGAAGRTYAVCYATNMTGGGFRILATHSNIPCAAPGPMTIDLPDLPDEFQFFGVRVRK